MKQQILFQESQRFSQWWIWTIMIGATVLFIVRMASPDSGGLGHGSTVTIIISSVALVSAIVILGFSKLETEIRTDGIYVRFIPFHRTVKKYAWSDLEMVEVRKYSPIAEYGGWGLRGVGKNRAFNISGSTGIQLVTKKGAKLLIGTQRPEDAQAVIQNLFNKSSNATTTP